MKQCRARVMRLRMTEHGPRATLWVCAAALALCGAAQAITAESPLSGVADANPYQGIVERNVFGLKPPPPPPDPNDVANKTPPPKITLTGITTLGVKRALLKVPAQPGKAGEAGKTEQSSILREGERDGELEVVRIDVDAKKVEVTYNGQPVTVEFDKDAGKNLAGGAQPGGVGPRPGGIPGPTGMPSHMANPAASPGFGMPARPVRGGFQPQGAAMNPGVSTMPGAGMPSVNVGGTALPAFGSTPGTYGQQQQVLPQIDPEEQAIMIEAQREQAKMKGNPFANLLPPTALNPTANTVPLPNSTPAQTPTTTPPQNMLPYAPGVRTPMPPMPQ